MVDRSKLRELAEKATGSSDEALIADESLLEACHPAAVLELLDELERVERERDEARRDCATWKRAAKFEGILVSDSEMRAALARGDVEGDGNG